MFDRAAIVRPLDRCRIVAGEVNRDSKRAARQAAPAYTRSVHVHRAAEPSSPASPAPLRTHVSTANQVACVQYHVAAAREQQRRAQKSASLFSRALAISLYIHLWYKETHFPLFLEGAERGGVRRGRGRVRRGCD